MRRQRALLLSLLLGTFAPSCRSERSAAASVADAWVRERTPTHQTEYQLRWVYQTTSGRTSGRATVHIAPPDSMRLDYRAPLGRRGAAVIVGDRVEWSDRPDDVERMFRIVPLFWAALGIPSRPSETAAVSADSLPGERTWRYQIGDTTLTFVERRQAMSMLTAMITDGGRPVATSFAGVDDITWLPTDGRIRMENEDTLLSFTIDAVDTTVTIDPVRWRRPER